MMKKVKEPFKNKVPSKQDIDIALKTARKISPKLKDLMDAREKKDTRKT